MAAVKTFLDFSSHFQTDGFRAGFSLFKESFDPSRDSQDLAKMMGFDPDKLTLPGQTHSTNVLIVDSPGNFPDVDGLVSSQKNVVLSIQVADCIPLFLLDEVNCTMGLVHAGWRGTANGIVFKALDRFSEMGSNLFNVKALIGPSIGQCCFEIGPGVAENFKADFLRKGKVDRSFLDLSNALKNQLIDSGLNINFIFDINRCTCCEKDTFYSYRRDGARAGRMIAICGWG